MRVLCGFSKGTKEDSLNPSVTKLIKSGDRALYFSRAPVPSLKNGVSYGLH